MGPIETKAGQSVFREPKGAPTSLVFFAVSITFAAIYGYFGILLGSGAIQNLVMSGAFAVAGVGEALPAERRRVAGGLRVLAIGTLLALVILSLVAPDVLGI